MIQVLIAAHLTSRHEEIRSRLASRVGIQVVGETDNGSEALRLIQHCHPDVFLTDISVPMMNGLAAAKGVKEAFPDVHVIILMSAEEEYVLRALKVGAEGYLQDDASGSELERAILSVARGETYLCSVVSRVLVNYVRRTAGPLQPIESLSRRQRKVLQLIAGGKTTKDMARILGISVKTVETHRDRLMGGLHLHDIAGLVRYAILSGVAGD